MISVIYGSSAHRPLSDSELLAILETSRRNNAKWGITGMLLYRSGNFLQVLEGEEDVIDELLERIHSDPRHHEVIEYSRRTITEREFGEWLMGFTNLEHFDMDAISGFSDVLKRPLHMDYFPNTDTFAKTFIEMFRQGVR